ncbi:MAG: alpha/beta fold hydrolase [Blastocatellales bacterium]
MLIKPVPGTDLKYYLVNYDKDGKERFGGEDGVSSSVLLDELKTGNYTDVIIMSHGWMGDVPAAIEQYNKWMPNLFTCSADIAAMKKKRPGFKPLLIGLHWPSLPWGDEDDGGSFGFDPNSEVQKIIQAAVDDYAARLGDTPEIRKQLETVLTAAIDEHDTMPDEVKAAYLALGDSLGLNNDQDFSAEDLNGRVPDPEQIFKEAVEQENEDLMSGSFGKLSLFGTLLSPLRTFSFWTMKNRARSFGEGGANELLRKMQKIAADAGRNVDFHLMGHSFGCIVVTAMAAGNPNDVTTQAPVSSMTLVQGALSIWAYTPNIPKNSKPGYFNFLLKNARVKGPIVTTQSEHDRALGFSYKLGAGIAGQVSFGNTGFPEIGALGTFGIQGLDQLTEGLTMKKVSEAYNFKPGRIYNLESSDVIKNGGGFAGAHSDITHPEVAHALWQAALAG